MAMTVLDLTYECTRGKYDSNDLRLIENEFHEDDDDVEGLCHVTTPFTLVNTTWTDLKIHMPPSAKI
jgi:hypothetical protein